MKEILKIVFHAICHPYWRASSELQHGKGEFRELERLYSGWNEDLPDAPIRRSWPTNREELDEINEWVFGLDDDQIKALLAENLPEDSRVEIHQYYPEPDNDDDEPSEKE